MAMRVLIVENCAELGALWKAHLERLDVYVDVVRSQEDAVEALAENEYNILILDMDLKEGSPSAVADYASYRRPDTKAILVTASSFFSDGSVFRYMPNACVMVPNSTLPSDMVALVDYHARAPSV